ncbi:uncharacterized protein UDID_06349 [Ustilago sp. UG-2017a]|nr:uncharacterized protein UDID_06349 [Ustilago sp. UG-2017a]
MPPSTSNDLVPVDSLSATQIQSYLDSYPSAIAHKASLSSTAPKPGEGLADLDNWYQSLPALTASSDLKKGIKGKAELEKLMRWKLAREKHRPTLMSLIKSNPAATCTNVITRASTHLLSHSSRLSSEKSSAEELLKAVEGTMRILAELRGVGPATSSAIVASWVEWGVFQSDELVMSLMGKGVKIEYSWGFYKKFYRLAVHSLRGWRKDGKVGSAREMERVAWSVFYSPNSLGEAGALESKPKQETGLEEESRAKEKKTKESGRGTAKEKVRAKTKKEGRGEGKRKTALKAEPKVEEDQSESAADTASRSSKRTRTAK